MLLSVIESDIGDSLATRAIHLIGESGMSVVQIRLVTRHQMIANVQFGDVFREPEICLFSWKSVYIVYSLNIAMKAVQSNLFLSKI